MKLGSVGTTFGGLTGKSKAHFGNGDARYVTFVEVMESSRLRGRHLGRVVTHKGEKQSEVRRGDVLFNTSSETPEEVALGAHVDFDVPPRVHLNSFCFGYRVTVPGTIDPRFLAYYFRSGEGRRMVASLAQGATRYNISKTKLLEMPIVLPLYREQRAIAEALTDCDDHIDALNRLIAKKRDVKQGMMQELLTGRTRLPGFASEWQKVTLGDRVSYLRTVALSRDQLDRESPLRYLHYGDIHTRTSILLDAKNEVMPRADVKLAGKASRLMPGDLVFADASEDPAGVGKSVELTSVPVDGVVPGLHTIAARFDKQVLVDGFKAYLQVIPEFRAALLRLAAGTKVLATTRAYISSIALVLPPIDEQRAIAGLLRDADAEIEALERRLESARAVKVGMMQELLTGRTRLPVGEES